MQLQRIFGSFSSALWRRAIVYSILSHESPFLPVSIFGILSSPNPLDVDCYIPDPSVLSRFQ